MAHRLDAARPKPRSTAAIGEADRHGLDPDDFLGPHRPRRHARRARRGPEPRRAHLCRGARPRPHRSGAAAPALHDPAPRSRPRRRPRPGARRRRPRRLARRPRPAGRRISRAFRSAYLEANRQIAAAQGRPAPALLDRARTLAVNLERRRWLERDAAADPDRRQHRRGDARLLARRPGRRQRAASWSASRARETPSLASPLYRLVANPTWTVPRSIEESEIAPKGAGYMARNDMEWRDGRIVQQSGPRNSLGLVKFDMRTTHAIYLHDTPAKALFGADRAPRQPWLRPRPRRARLRRDHRPGRRRARPMGARPAAARRTARRRRSSPLPRADPGPAALPYRLCRERPGGDRARRLWLGRGGRRGARPPRRARAAPPGAAPATRPLTESRIARAGGWSIDARVSPRRLLSLLILVALALAPFGRIGMAEAQAMPHAMPAAMAESLRRPATARP